MAEFTETLSPLSKISLSLGLFLLIIIFLSVTHVQQTQKQTTLEAGSLSGFKVQGDHTSSLNSNSNPTPTIFQNLTLVPSRALSIQPTQPERSVTAQSQRK